MLLVKVDPGDIIKGVDHKILSVQEQLTNELRGALLLKCDEVTRKCFTDRIKERCELEIRNLEYFKTTIERSSEHFLTFDEVMKYHVFKEKE